MATLSFEGETHGELVVKVRRWLASVEGQKAGSLTPTEAVVQGAELTKEALRVIAAAAPEPIAQNEVVKALTSAGYKVTDTAKDALVDSLDSVEELTGGSVLKMARDARRSAMYQMNSAIAKQVLRALRG
ncbi:MAG TPA: hypothetical protein VHA73_00810 [Acidimicrobiales bacterium]|jgi:hypothetical protein|nr:hypothetical protein [Acidimicrobiales bacterium]